MRSVPHPSPLVLVPCTDACVFPSHSLQGRLPGPARGRPPPPLSPPAHHGAEGLTGGGGGRGRCSCRTGLSSGPKRQCNQESDDAYRIEWERGGGACEGVRGGRARSGCARGGEWREREQPVLVRSFCREMSKLSTTVQCLIRSPARARLRLGSPLLRPGGAAVRGVQANAVSLHSSSSTFQSPRASPKEVHRPKAVLGAGTVKLRFADGQATEL